MAKNTKVRNDVIKEVRLLLGDGMVDIELDPDHYDLAVDVALSKIRQRSENAVEEDFYAMELKKDVDEYTLPAEIVEVKKIHHRSFGHGISGGVDMDPFELAYANSYFFLNNHIGGLATFEAFAQYRESLNRVAATDIQYIWNPTTNKIKLLRRMRADEMVLMHVHLERPEEQLLVDPYLKSWMRDYTLAYCKKMLGEARSKFSSLPGAQGGVSLNGAEMKNEADVLIDKLEQDLSTYIDGSSPLGFVIG
jgi:hypothetical protein|tara:strand:- start:1760 stop:2509 length:750 start_codon:yes stop_codon:yes gene_type:complete